MPQILKFLRPLTLNGEEMPKGHITEIDDISAESLIRDGHAEPVEGETPANEEIPAQAVGDELDPVTKIRKALDAQYTRDVLADEAKKIGVEFSYNAKKGEIIDAVIVSGKADALLK